jgi:hypothetical protein
MSKSLFPLIPLCVVFLAVFTFPAHATDVSGTIAADTVWDVAGSPYNVVGNVTVNATATLRIDASVLVSVLTMNGPRSGGFLTGIPPLGR